MTSDLDDERGLLERARGGDREALNALFEAHRDRLRRMVEVRLDWRLRARIDASDVVQDAYLEVVGRLDGYLRDPKLPLFLWLRLVVGEQLIDLRRRHLKAQARDAGREVPLYRDPMPEAGSEALAALLLGDLTSPTAAAVRAERLMRLQEALDALEPIDREILSLRHFEQLNRSEAALALGIAEAAAAKRYIRALRRLKDAMAARPGGLSGL